MKIAILGGNGRLGSIMKKLYPDWLYSDKKETDITNRNSVEKFLNYKPSIIINLAAITNAQECARNPKICWTVNAYGVRVLSEICRDHNIKLIHISTDYVLDPRTEYAWSKVAGEAVALAGRATVLRTNIYDHQSYLVQKVLEEKPFKAYRDIFFNPLSMVSFGKMIPKYFREKGLFSIGTNQRISMSTFAKEVCKVFGKKLSIVEPVAYKQSDGDMVRAKDTFFKADNVLSIEQDLKIFYQFYKTLLI